MIKNPQRPIIVNCIVQNRHPHVSAKLLLTENWAMQNVVNVVNFRMRKEKKMLALVFNIGKSMNLPICLLLGKKEILD